MIDKKGKILIACFFNSILIKIQSGIGAIILAIVNNKLCMDEEGGCSIYTSTIGLFNIINIEGFFPLIKSSDCGCIES